YRIGLESKRQGMTGRPSSHKAHSTRGSMHDATAARFTGAIPDYYERALGPVIFTDYAADLARRAAASSPERVLETAAGTGIVTRQLRDLLPAGSRLDDPPQFFQVPF